MVCHCAKSWIKRTPTSKVMTYMVKSENKVEQIQIEFIRSPCLKTDICRVQIPNGRWWPFILIVYRDGWKVWGWSQANICPLYGRWVLGSRIWLPLAPWFTGADGAPMACSTHLSQISSLGKLLYGIWRACAPFQNILGGFPRRTWCFPPMKEVCPT